MEAFGPQKESSCVPEGDREVGGWDPDVLVQKSDRGIHGRDWADSPLRGPPSAPSGCPAAASTDSERPHSAYHAAPFADVFCRRRPQSRASRGLMPVYSSRRPRLVHFLHTSSRPASAVRCRSVVSCTALGIFWIPSVIYSFCHPVRQPLLSSHYRDNLSPCQMPTMQFFSYVTTHGYRKITCRLQKNQLPIAPEPG